MRDSTDVASATSAVTASASPPPARISFATCDTSCSPRAARTTRAPSWAKRRAVVAPIPRLAPVMSATLPARRGGVPVCDGFNGGCVVIALYLLYINLQHTYPGGSLDMPCEMHRPAWQVRECLSVQSRPNNQDIILRSYLGDGLLVW